MLRSLHENVIVNMTSRAAFEWAPSVDDQDYQGWDIER